MANMNPNKPKKNHPWKNSVSSDIHRWAKEQSETGQVVSVFVQRSENMKQHSSYTKQKERQL